MAASSLAAAGGTPSPRDDGVQAGVWCGRAADVLYVEDHRSGLCLDLAPTPKITSMGHRGSVARMRHAGSNVLAGTIPLAKRTATPRAGLNRTSSATWAHRRRVTQ